MADRTLTINHADGGSETYTINRDKFAGVREMQVDGATVAVDHTAVPKHQSKEITLGGSQSITIKRDIEPLLSKVVGGAAAAYSLRDLNDTTGVNKVVRVRRESDNNERDFNAKEVSNGTLQNWTNAQVTPPLDVRELTATGRDGPIIEAAAAYSLRNLSDSYAGDVVEVRRNTDGALKDFKASEVTDGTLEAWVNTSFANALPLDTAGAAAAAYSLRNLSSSYTGSVVEVRRSSDGTLRSFTAAEVTDGTLTTWVTTSLSNGVFINNGYETFSGASASGFTASNTTSAGFANSVIPAGVTGDRLKVSFDLVVASGSPRVALRATTSTGTASNPLDITTSGSYTATLTATGPYSYVGFSEGDVPSEFTVSNFQIIGQDGTVSKWYDQSGNDKHATQGTPASQPKIVSGGSLVSGGLDFDGVDDYLEASSAVNEPIATIISVNKSNNVTTTSRPFGIRDSDAGANEESFAQAADFSLRFDGSFQAGTITPTLNQNLRFSIRSTTTAMDYVDSVENINAVDVLPNVKGLVNIGATIDNSSSTFDGTIAECILYNSDQSDKRRAIESNIASHYSITLPTGSNPGSVDGFVSTWYDQSGNANDAVQATTTSQPKIVDTGALVAGGLDFDGVDDMLETINTESFGVSSRSLFSVCAPLSVGVNDNAIVQLSTTSGDSGTGWLVNGELATRTNAITWISSTPASTSSGNLISDIYTSGNLHAGNSMWLNGNSVARTGGTDGAINTATSTIVIGSGTGGTAAFDGAIGEVIIYKSDQSANRTGIETNINAEYSIYA